MKREFRTKERLKHEILLVVRFNSTQRLAVIQGITEYLFMTVKFVYIECYSLTSSRYTQLNKFINKRMYVKS